MSWIEFRGKSFAGGDRVRRVFGNKYRFSVEEYFYFGFRFEIKIEFRDFGFSVYFVVFDWERLFDERIFGFSGYVV